MMFSSDFFVFRLFRRDTGYKLIRDDAVHSATSTSAKADTDALWIRKFLQDAIIRLRKIFPSLTVFSVTIISIIVLIGPRQYGAMIGLEDVTDSYHPFPNNNTIPVASPSVIALAKVSAIFSFFDWFPPILFAEVGKSRSPIIIFGNALMMAVPFTTIITAIPPIIAIKNANSNSYGYKWNSYNSTFYWTDTGVGRYYDIYALTLTAHVLAFTVSAFYILLKIAIPSTARLPRYYKPCSLEPKDGQEIELEEDPKDDGYLAKVFARQERSRKLVDKVAIYIDTHTGQKPRIEHNFEPKFELRERGEHNYELCWESTRNCKACESTASAAQIQDDEGEENMTRWPTTAVDNKSKRFHFGLMCANIFEALFQVGRVVYIFGEHRDVSQYYWGRWQMIMLLVYPFASAPLFALFLTLLFCKIPFKTRLLWCITYADIIGLYGIVSNAFGILGYCMTVILAWSPSTSTGALEMIICIIPGALSALFHILMLVRCLSQARWIPWLWFGMVLLKILSPLRYLIQWIVHCSRLLKKMLFHLIDCYVFEKEDRDFHRSQMTIGTMYKPLKDTKVGHKDISAVSRPELFSWLLSEFIRSALTNSQTQNMTQNPSR